MKTFLKVKSKIVELLTSQTVAVFFFFVGKRSVHVFQAILKNPH